MSNPKNSPFSVKSAAVDVKSDGTINFVARPFPTFSSVSNFLISARPSGPTTSISVFKPFACASYTSAIDFACASASAIIAAFLPSASRILASLLPSSLLTTACL